MKKTSWILVAVALVAALALVVRRTERSAAGSRDLHSASAAPVSKLSTASMKPVPDLSLKDLAGKQVDLKDFRGKVVLVNFWATWCDPCRAEIPSLIELQKKYGAQGFQVLGVAMDDEGLKVVQPFVEKERFDVGGQKLAMNYPILIGDADEADKFLGGIGGIVGLPTSVLVSRDGKRVKNTIGPVDPDQLERQIQSLL
ncbi:MAG TPA: TlpA disulfide reductase family protein [Candidatus Acidoferrales bacterium]|nr:TlpA disulfide reductase family protein [Candidatus Acidoferrales bacterium]